VTAKELSQIAEKENIRVAPSSVNAHLRSKKFEEYGSPMMTIKRLHLHSEARYSFETLEQRKKFVHDYQLIKSKGKCFVFLDESPFNAAVMRKEGRSPLGERCILPRSRTTFETVTASTAISELSGLLHVTFVEGSVTEVVFSSFLISVIEHLQLLTKESAVLVMDNVSFHKTLTVQGLLRAKNYDTLYTAPNSCELHAIEYVFGIWKSRLRIPPEVHTCKQLIPVLAKSLDLVKKTEVVRCIRMVEMTLFPLALHGMHLSLTNMMTRIDPMGIVEEDFPPLEEEDDEPITNFLGLVDHTEPGEQSGYPIIEEQEGEEGDDEYYDF
jgi:hypothetical protein